MIILEVVLEDENIIEVFSKLEIRIEKLKYDLIVLSKASNFTTAKLN